MLLTIDVGNTNTVLGMFDGDQIVEHWRINTDPDRTADEIAVLLHGLLGSGRSGPARALAAHCVGSSTNADSGRPLTASRVRSAAPRRAAALVTTRWAAGQVR